ncbi:MAG: phosphoribosylaminoimidazolesuccinocarboxamide synthase [Planctomycetota bacterium]
MNSTSMNSPQAVTNTDLDFPKRSGKVRDIYDLGDSLLIVSTDRISAFDWILAGGIPRKGVVLTQISRFWFEQLGVANHMLSTELPDDLAVSDSQRTQLEGRSMIVKKAEVVPFECVVRGYLEGSGWKEYQEAGGEVCGIKLPEGLQQCSRLAEPTFTPATKAEEGHDENVSYEFMGDKIGEELATQLRDKSLEVYTKGCELAAKQGIIIADTKFEWGMCDGELILIDEVLTPDSSRFWPAAEYEPGRAQKSFDKQFVREWLMGTDWDRNSEPPELPEEIVSQTAAKYLEVYERLTGKKLDV